MMFNLIQDRSVMDVTKFYYTIWPKVSTEVILQVAMMLL